MDIFPPFFRKRFTWLRQVREDSFTLALAYFIKKTFHNIIFNKNIQSTSFQKLNKSLGVFNIIPNVNVEEYSKEAKINKRKFIMPGYSHYPIIKHKKWIKIGMQEVLNQYHEFIKKLNQMQIRAKIAIMYNPCSYEIYRGLVIKKKTEYDEISQLQRNSIKAFYKKTLEFILLIFVPVIRKIIEKQKIWIYGKRDVIHWSKMGSNLISHLLEKELRKYIEKSKK